MNFRMLLAVCAIATLFGCAAKGKTTIEHNDGTRSVIYSDRDGYRLSSPHSVPVYWTRAGNSVESVIQHMNNTGWGGGVKGYSGGGGGSLFDPIDMIKLEK